MCPYKLPAIPSNAFLILQLNSLHAQTMMHLRLILLLAVLGCAAAAAEAPAEVRPTASNSSEFIRTRCETTQYPELCYHSLSGYANSVQQDPARLALVAIGVSLRRATSMSAYVANLTRQNQSPPDPRAAAALRDCAAVFGDAADQMRGSMKQMRQLAPFGAELRFQMSNVQTWMSAALTNEETCTDGFESVADCPMKADVCDRTVGVKEVTSNALALVNSYASNF